jgi:hypothetical protein
LLGSRCPASRETDAQAKVQFGNWRSGDRFFLMTDALAEWFLRRHERQGKPWQALARRLATSDAALTRFVERLRKKNELKNDDVTLVRIDLKR